jgi:hypothetical protein
MLPSLLLTVFATFSGGTQDALQESPAAQSPATPIEVSPEERERRLQSLYEGTLAAVQDGQDFAETPDYRRLLEIIGSYREHELTAKAPPPFERAAVLADPARWRGELVRVRGLLAGMIAVRLAHPIGEHTDAFRAFITEPDGEDGIVVDFLHQPPDLSLEKDVVETEAVFVRTVSYEAKNGKIAVAPYLVARDLRELDTSALRRRTAFDQFALILIGVATAYLVIRVVMTMRSRKERGDPDPARATRLIRERARAAFRARPTDRP